VSGAAAPVVAAEDTAAINPRPFVITKPLSCAPTANISVTQGFIAIPGIALIKVGGYVKQLIRRRSDGTFDSFVTSASRLTRPTAAAVRNLPRRPNRRLNMDIRQDTQSVLPACISGRIFGDAPV
jgi:hypothetical protein